MRILGLSDRTYGEDGPGADPARPFLLTSDGGRIVGMVAQRQICVLFHVVCLSQDGRHFSMSLFVRTKRLISVNVKGNS